MFQRSILFVLLIISLTARGHSTPTGVCSLKQPPIRPLLQKPNFVVFFADDMGYGDLASYGHPTQERGPIDDVMVRGGIRFTQGYVPDTVCTPSRTALLTGRYPARVGVYSLPGGPRVFKTWIGTGLPQDEVTLPEALKQAGYTTGMVGKWHLGINNSTHDDGVHLPMNHGFDFVGHIIPYTNVLRCDNTGRFTEFPNIEKCTLMKRDKIIAQPYNQTYLAQTFVNEAVSFINDNADDPFFFYFSFAQPHVSLFASPQFAGKSRRGEYGDTINEMSWAVGEVLDALEANGLSQNTLVFFTSDQGPQPEYCSHGGDASIFKGYKANTWEGGVRVPFVAYWPGMITPHESDELVSTLDIMPTLVELANGSLPSYHVYDGEVITDVLLKNAQSPHDVLFFYCKDRLMAVRSGPYKVHYYTQRVQSREYFADQCAAGGLPSRHYFDCDHCYGSCVTEHNPPLIYNVDNDPTEAYPLNNTIDPALTDFMTKLTAKVETHKADLVFGTPILDFEHQDISTKACCNPDTNCICNYGPVTGPYD